MEERLRRALLSLKEGMEKDARYKKLDELEDDLSANPEIAALSAEMKQKADIYAKIAEQDGEEAIRAQRELAKAKLALDERPEVRDYLQAYGETRRLSKEIEDILMEGLSGASCGDCHA